MSVESGLLCVQSSKLYLNQFYVVSVKSSLYVQYSRLCINSLHAFHVVSVETYMY